MKKAVTEFGTFEFDEVDNLIDELNSKELIMWNEVLNCAFSKFVSEDGTDLDTFKYDHDDDDVLNDILDDYIEMQWDNLSEYNKLQVLAELGILTTEAQGGNNNETGICN